MKLNYYITINYSTIPKKIVLMALFIFSTQLVAQVDSSYNREVVDFNSYLAIVGSNNLNYAAEKFNLNVAQAQIEFAKIFPDPVLEVGTYNNGQQRLQTGYGATMGITRTIELGGKRKARINLANSEKELATALLADFFRNLRADASNDFLQALKEKSTLRVKLNSYQNMKQLADANQVRYELGSAMEIDAVQSKVEAEMLLNEVIQTDADLKTALMQLSLWVGKQTGDTLYFPIGDMRNADRNFDLPSLITTAQNNRADVLAALKNKEVAEKTLKLARANRVMNMDVSFTNTYFARISNIIEPTPSYNMVGGGIAMPLRFSNKYQGELKMAETQIKQANIQYQAVELRIAVQVTQAYNQYKAAQRKVEQFNLQLLQQSKKVLEGKIYSYKRGATSLLEVLNAQRTFNEIQLNYYETLLSYSSSLVELERSAGIWDINF